MFHSPQSSLVNELADVLFPHRWKDWLRMLPASVSDHFVPGIRTQGLHIAFGIAEAAARDLDFAQSFCVSIDVVLGDSARGVAMKGSGH